MALKRGGFGRMRRWGGAAEGLTSSVAVVLFVAALVYAATRPTLRHRWDFTEGATYTLEDQTRSILASLAAPVEVVTLFSPELQPLDNGLTQVQLRAADYVRHLLEEYAIASDGRLTVRHLDPNADRVEVEELKQRFHITRYNVVLMQCRERTRQVYLEEMVTIDRGWADPAAIEPAQLVAFHGEGPLTSAVLSVTDERPPKVVFVGGYDGPEITDFDVFGLGLLAEALRGQGFVVESAQIDPSGPARFAADVDVVALVGPMRELDRRTLEALQAHYERGGALFLAPLPMVEDKGLDALLDRLGLMRERNAVATRDDGPYEGPRRTVLTVRRFQPDHPVSAPIAKRGFFARFSMAGHLARAFDAAPELRTTSLVLTDANVFGDLWSGPQQPGNYQFDEGREVRAERILGMAVEGGPGRVVCFAGAGFLGNSYVGAGDGGPGNMDLALNAMNWLAEREQAVASRPREAFESRVDLLESERGDVFLYVVVLMPLGGALLGVLVWFSRRR